MDGIDWAQLAERTGEIFEFGSDAGWRTVAQLVSAERREFGGTVALTLTFRSEDGIAAQGTYAVTHPDIGTFALFVVPRSRTEFDADVTWLDAP